MRTRQSDGPTTGSCPREAATCSAFALGVLLLPVAAQCESWEYVPTIATGVTYETNPNYIS